MGFDLVVFKLLYGLAHRSDFLDGVLLFCATYLPFLMLALFAAYVVLAWRTQNFKDRVGDAVHAAWAVAIGFLMERLIGFFWFRFRPFVQLPEVVRLVQRLPDEKSFPSAHATFTFALAFAIARHNKKWGSILLILAACVSLARVAVGVHYPSDILAGALVGFCAALLAVPAKKAVEPYLELFPVFRKYKKREV